VRIVLYTVAHDEEAAEFLNVGSGRIKPDQQKQLYTGLFSGK
jgi:hypothetical protein